MSQQGESDLRRTLRESQDEYFDFLCESCLAKNRVEAQGHCKQCSKNLCCECIKEHTKNEKTHIIENKPRRNELDTLKLELKKLKERLHLYRHDSKRFQTEIIESYTEVVEQIKKWRSEMGKTLDELEKDLIEKASILKRDTLGSLAESSITCRDLKRSAKKVLKDLDEKLKLDQATYSISVKQAQESLSKMLEDADSIGKYCKSRQLSFYRHENIVTSVCSLGLGTVYLTGSPENFEAEYVRDVYIKSNTDVQDCYITSVIDLQDGRLCLCDSANRSIKLVDTKFMEISEQIPLSDEPFDVTMINQNELAVLNTRNTGLDILSLLPSLHYNRTIELIERYNGIIYCDDKMFLSSFDIIDICNMEGEIIKRIKNNVDGSEIFTDVARLCVSPDHTKIYVTDKEKHSVVCMNMEGEVISVLRNETLKIPFGITVDQDGNVYVCSSDNHMIHQLTPTGQLVQTLLGEEAGIKYPLCMAYKSGYLYTICSPDIQKNNMVVYRLTQKR